MATECTALEVELEVEYIHHEAYPAIYERGGLAISPAEPAYAELLSVKIGKIDIMSELSEKALEALKEDIEGDF